MTKAIIRCLRILIFSNVVCAANGQTTGNANGHDYVDLGLPSGTLWATCNIGANAPEEAGDLFAWGEVSPKTSFSLPNYELYKSVTTEPDADGFTTTFSGYTKYVMEADASIYGLQDFYDNLSLLEQEDDAASVLWEGLWRIPTWEEIMEIRNQCTWDWGALNGMDGYKVTGPNGNYIFFPAGGYNVGRKYSGGRYWSSNLGEMESRTAPCLDFSKWDVSGYSGNRYYGYSIRPVYKDANTPKLEPCEIPSISYNNGRLSFNCETKGAKFVYSITCQDAKSATVADGIDLDVTYIISVYAIADGHEKSEEATATLCWIDSNPTSEGITEGFSEVKARSILVQTDEGVVSISGANEGEQVTVYDINGIYQGTAVVRNNTARVPTFLSSKSVAIIKIGHHTVKVMMK